MECSMPVTKTVAPTGAVALERDVTILARQALLDEADAVPGVEPRVERSQAGGHRGRRQIEAQEAKRYVVGGGARCRDAWEPWMPAAASAGKLFDRRRVQSDLLSVRHGSISS